jgi:hypothetical protein
MQKMTMYYNQADAIGKKVWSIVAADARATGILPRNAQMIPALNAMIDITTTRRSAGEAMIPDSIMYVLFILCLSSSFLMGYEQVDKIDWPVLVGFSLTLSLTVFNIIDLDRPRSGLITMKTANEKIVELRDMFREE